MSKNTKKIRRFWATVITALVLLLGAVLATDSTNALPIDNNGHTICPPGASNRGGTGPGNSHNGLCLVTPTVVPTKVPHTHH